MPQPTFDPSNISLAQTIPEVDITALPLSTQGILYTILFVCAGLSILIPRIGFLQGAKADKKPEPTFAAVIVDNTALNGHTAAVNRLADNLAKHTEELDRVREEMRLDRELRRQRQLNG